MMRVAGLKMNKVEVETDHSIFVPNVFTPNGDGVNDVFEVYGPLSSLAFFEIKIFDRWGEKYLKPMIIA